MAERITAETVAAELDVLDGEAKLVVGQIVVSIGVTNAAVKQLVPREWEALASYLFTVLAQEPMKSSPAFVGHRIVLGSLAMELRGFAQQAGEPVGLQVDLRNAGSQAAERRIRERIADDAAAFSRHIDDVLDADTAQRAAAEAAYEVRVPVVDGVATLPDGRTVQAAEGVVEVVVPLDPGAAPSIEPDDDLAYL